jgi:hypothetical protein
VKGAGAHLEAFEVGMMFIKS